MLIEQKKIELCTMIFNEEKPNRNKKQLEIHKKISVKA